MRYQIAFPLLLLILWKPLFAEAEEHWTVCFTPGMDCTGQIVAAIEGAQDSVDIQAYSFTSAAIAKALVEAKRRGVRVRVILDKSQLSERYSSAKFLVNAGIPVWIDDRVAIAHNKVMIIDDEIVITGSFNFTRSAQDRNAENLLIIKDANLATLYEWNWQSRLTVSRPYDSPQ